MWLNGKEPYDRQASLTGLVWSPGRSSQQMLGNFATANTTPKNQAPVRMTYLTGTMQPERGQPGGQTGILHT